MTDFAVYEVGDQPCQSFRSRDELADRGVRGNVHECYCATHPGCQGTRSFCDACHADHHSGGWDRHPVRAALAAQENPT